jgi:sigma-B regulation protein RsbU (phosphoserine phosphatase)
MTAGTAAGGLTGFGVEPLRGEPCLPLGIDADEQYADHVDTFMAGDTVLFYTDGITEAREPAGELFGTGRLDEILSTCDGDAAELVACTLDEVERFTNHAPPSDDRTLLAARMV